VNQTADNSFFKKRRALIYGSVLFFFQYMAFSQDTLDYETAETSKILAVRCLLRLYFSCGSNTYHP